MDEEKISMTLGAMVVIALGFLIFNYFSKADERGVVKPRPTPVEESRPDLRRLNCVCECEDIVK